MKTLVFDITINLLLTEKKSVGIAYQLFRASE